MDGLIWKIHNSKPNRVLSCIRKTDPVKFSCVVNDLIDMIKYDLLN